MNPEAEKILTRAENQRREERKRQDRGELFRQAVEVKELIARAKAQLKEIEAAVKECGPFIERCDRLGLQNQIDCRPWILDYQAAAAKLHAIPAAVAWLEGLVERNFSEHYSSNYPWPDQLRVFLAEFSQNQNGNGDGVARGIRQKHALLEFWVLKNADELAGATIKTAIMPPDGPGPRAPLNNLDP